MKKFFNWLFRDYGIIYFLVFLLQVSILVILILLSSRFNPDTDYNNTNVLNTINMSQVDTAENLASPDLTGKEYLGNGEYQLRSFATYNVYTGIIKLNGLASNLGLFSLIQPLEKNNDYTFTFYYVSGKDNVLDLNAGTATYRFIYTTIPSQFKSNPYINTVNWDSDVEHMVILNAQNRVFDNLELKLQLEKGSTATPYEVPKQALEQHIQFEKDNSYNDGYNIGSGEGYDEGFDDGEYNGFNAGLNNVYTFHTLIDFLSPFEFDNGGDLKAFRYRFSNYGLELEDMWLGEILDMASWRYYSRPLKYILNISYDDKNSYLVYDLRDTYNSPSTITKSLIQGDFERVEITVNLDNFVIFRLYDRYRNVVYELNSDDDLELMQNLDIAVFTNINQTDFQKGYENGFKQGKDEGYTSGKSHGYNEGLAETDAIGFNALLTTIFVGLGGFLSINILPNISIGAIIAVPIVFGLIYFIIGRRKGD